MKPQVDDPVNIWALPKVATLRLLLLTLSNSVDIRRLMIDQTNQGNRQAVHLSDRQIKGLSAYLYTYAQPEHCYGLELIYPDQANGVLPPYRPQEGLNLEQAIEQLCLHFELN
ncbi:MAG: hypothetical protein ABW076_11700 [Candidatus Thiodiazotropha sp.]